MTCLAFCGRLKKPWDLDPAGLVLCWGTLHLDLLHLINVKRAFLFYVNGVKILKLEDEHHTFDKGILLPT